MVPGVAACPASELCGAGWAAAECAPATVTRAPKHSAENKRDTCVIVRSLRQVCCLQIIQSTARSRLLTALRSGFIERERVQTDPDDFIIFASEVQAAIGLVAVPYACRLPDPIFIP